MEKPIRYQRRYTLYTALIAGGMMLAVYLLLGIWPFGDGTVISGDLGGLYLNFFAHLKQAILGQAGFAYGFDKGLGGSLMGLFAYYYSSPFNLLYLLFPLRWFPVGASVVLFCKVVLACTFFRVYIAHKWPKLKWRSVPVALCYGFLTYGFAYAQNIMWHDVVLLLPLLCLGIDKITEGGGFGFYTAILAVAIFANFYIAFMACIFAVIYFFYTMLVRTPTARTAGWKGPLWRFAAGSLLGGGLCAGLLVPALSNINQNKGALLDYHFTLAQNFPLYRLPERFLWGSFAATDVQDTLPMLYCGMLVLVLVCTYFASRAVPLREKLLGAGVIALFVLSLWIQGLDTLWHGGKIPIWFPARYSYLLCFFLAMLAARAIAQKAAGRRELIIGGGLLFVALLVICAFPVAISRSRILLSAAAVLFFCFCLLFAANASTLQRRRLLYGAVTFVVSIELCMNAFYVTRQLERYPLSHHQNFVDTSGVTADAIQAADADDYRIAENQFYNLNTSMLLGYKGITHFASTQDNPAQYILYSLGYRTYGATGPYLSGGTAFADGAIAYRYLMDSGGRVVPSHWRLSGITAPLPVYENPYALPMLFAVPAAGASTPATGEEGDMFAFQNALYAAMGGEGQLFTPAGNVRLTTQTGEALPLTGEVPPGAVYTVTAQQSGYHYAWVNAGTQLLPMVVNEQEQPGLYFAPDNEGVIDLGWLEQGQQATVYWLQTGDLPVKTALFVRMDEEKLQGLATEARANAGDFSLRDGHVGGRIIATEDRLLLYTSIPWDDDWQLTVNGAPTQPVCLLDGLLAVPLQPGENHVVLRFVPAGTAVGLTVTLICAVLYAAALARGVLRRRGLKTAPAAPQNLPGGSAEDDLPTSEGRC